MRAGNHQIMSPSIEQLLPHRAPMRWVDALLECTETIAIATVQVDENHFALRDSALLETALVECAAQTVAAALGQRMHDSGQPGASNQGMLIGVTSFKITAVPAVGSTLTIETREVKRLGPMLLVAATITSAGQPIASGELSLYA